MIAYRDLYNTLEGEFDGCELKHIGRESNEEADALANIGSTCAPIPPGVFFETINERSIKINAKVNSSKPTAHSGATPTDLTEGSATAEESAAPEKLAQVLLIEPVWTGPYIAYLARQEQPTDPLIARQIMRRSKSFTIINGELYKRSISDILQRCIAPEDGRKLLLDIHEGTCGHHASSRAIVGKAFRSGFYWLTASQDAKELV